MKAKLLLRVLTPPALLCSLAASAAAGDAGSIATFATRLAYDCITLPSSERTFVLTSVGEAENPLIQSSSGEIFVPRSFDLGSADLWKLAVKNEDSGAAEFGDLLTFTPSDPNITFTSAGPVKRNLDPHNLAAGQQVEFFWNGIEHASAPGELFDVWVRAEVRQGERYARLFSGVVNHSSVWSTYQYTFPYVEVETAGDPVAHRLTLPIQSGLILRNPVQNLPFFFFLEPDPAQSQFLLPPNHPGWLTMQWLGFWESTEPDQRLFYWSMLDGGADGEAGPWGKSVSFTTDPGAGSFTIAVTTRPEFNTTPGGTYVVDFPVAVGVLRGDWYDAALEYREWAEEQVWTQNGPLATNPRLSDEIREADMLGIATCTSCCNPTPVAPACPGGTFNDCNPTLPGTQVLTTEFSSWSGWRAEVEDHINYFGPDRMISSAYEWDLESFNNLVWGSWLEATPDQPVAEFAQGALDLLGAVSQYTWGFYFALDSYDSQAVGYDSLYIDGPLQGSSVEDFVVMDEDGTMLPEGADLSKFRHADCGVAPTGLCADSLKICFSTSFPLEYLKHFVGVLSAYGANGTYLDGFYARQQYCYDATHGHPLGGGRHWGQGKVDLIRGVRDYARNELGLTDFHVGLEWPLEAAIGETDFVWDGIGKWADITFNAPLFTTVYHRYIRVGTAGVNHSFDSDKIDTWFRARLRFAERLHSGFVPSGGVVLRSVFLEDDLVDPAYPHYQQYLAYVKDYMDLLKQGAAREVMTFGERLRDPVNHADLVTFRDVTGPQVFYLLYGWEQPAAYVSAWRSDDGSLGFLVTNWTDVDDDEETLPGDTEFWGTTSPGDQTFTFSIDPKAYGLADGTHRFAEITAAGTTPGTITFNQGATKRVTVTVPERSSKFLHLRP